MRDYVILTDSCCDLTADMAEELSLEVLPLSLEMSGAENAGTRRKLAELTARQQEVQSNLEEMEERWLYLSEFAE